MSGSGGGSSGEDGWRIKPKGGGDPGADPCNITEVTNLNSVVAAILLKLRVGDILSVVFLPGPPQRLVVQTAQSETAGSITSQSMLQIIQCLQNGVAYKATVLSIRSGLCQVRIERE